jgi:iron complex transport system substrate-binding protein
MYAVDVDVALVLDLPLVGGGTASGGANQPFASHQPEEELEGVRRLQTYPEANYEQIAALEPDCILDSTTDDGQQYERLSEVAPTLNYHKVLYRGENNAADWKAGLRSVVRAFGSESRAERFIDAYEERAAGLRERTAERWSDATFATVGAFEPGTILVTDTHRHPSRIPTNDLGLTPSDAMPETVEGLLDLSLERLDLLEDADLLFVRVEPAQEGGGRDRSILDPIRDSALWRRLPAVEKGRVVEYDAELYYPSPLTAEAFLDVVERSLLS